jgi:hypothetical protein
MRESGKRAVTVIIIANLLLISIGIGGHVLGRFDYSDHLDEVVITVDETGITLREFGYYIFQVESFVQKQALLYDPENPGHWWNTHFSAGLDSQFVCDLAKKTAINSCVAEEIYYREALNLGLVLSTGEEAQVMDDSKEMINNMELQQIMATGLDEEIIFDMTGKHALASKYAMILMGEIDPAIYPGEAARLVNWDGAFYLEEVLPRHKVKTNDRVLDKITLGKITVNQH